MAGEDALGPPGPSRLCHGLHLHLADSQKVFGLTDPHNNRDDQLSNLAGLFTKNKETIPGTVLNLSFRLTSPESPFVPQIKLYRRKLI